MKLNYPDWLKQIVVPGAFVIDEHSIAGISGGKTSALMAFLLDLHNPNDERLVFSFQNTGREHEKTYEFLNNLQQYLTRPIIWLEYQKPANYGAPPKESRTRIVDFDTADRTGKPFSDLLQALAEYRDFEKSLGPIAPNPTQRLCTAYLKMRTCDKYVQTLKWECYTRVAGLRADEPKRVARYGTKDTQEITSSTPLSTSNITNEHVKQFWSEQPFTLDIPENLGNCTLCFLKDEADLAFNMYYESSPEETQWWLEMQEKYGQFGRGTSYRQLLEEAPVRWMIREAVATNKTMTCPANFPPYRFKLLVRQEQRVAKLGIQRTPCSCEAAEHITDEQLL